MSQITPFFSVKFWPEIQWCKTMDKSHVCICLFYRLQMQMYAGNGGLIMQSLQPEPQTMQMAQGQTIGVLE